MIKKIKQWSKENIFVNYRQNGNDYKIYSFNFKNETDKSKVEKFLSDNFPDQLFKIKEKDGSIKAVHYTIENDKFGKHIVREQMNGIKVRCNVEPSEWYKGVLAERAEKDRIRREAEEAKRAEENLIKERMRQLAIEQLQKEGKI